MLEEQIERLNKIIERNNIEDACQEMFLKAENLSISLVEGIFQAILLQQAPQFSLMNIKALFFLAEQYYMSITGQQR